MSRVYLRPKARREISACIPHRERRGRSRETVSAGCRRTFVELARNPLIGAVRKVRRPEFRGVRMWRVRRFESYLVFYAPKHDRIIVERVIHSSQDYTRLLK